MKGEETPFLLKEEDEVILCWNFVVPPILKLSEGVTLASLEYKYQVASSYLDRALLTLEFTGLCWEGLQISSVS